LLAAGRLEDASEHYKAVIAKNPSQDVARLEFVQLLLQRSMASEAAEYFEVLKPKKTERSKNCIDCIVCGCGPFAGR